MVCEPCNYKHNHCFSNKKWMSLQNVCMPVKQTNKQTNVLKFLRDYLPKQKQIWSPKSSDELWQIFHRYYQTCIAFLNLSKYYLQELCLRTQMSRSLDQTLTRFYAPSSLAQSPHNVWLSPYVKRSLSEEFTASGCFNYVSVMQLAQQNLRM